MEIELRLIAKREEQSGVRLIFKQTHPDDGTIIGFPEVDLAVDHEDAEHYELTERFRVTLTRID